MLTQRTKKRIVIIFVIAFIIFGFTGFLTLAYVRGYEQQIYVEKDAYVYDFYPDTNYGADDYLRVGNYGSGKVQAIYYFNISAFPDSWREANIIVKFNFGSEIVDVGANITHEIWDESTLTWNNKPYESIYRGHILCDGFDFRIPLNSDHIIDGGVSVCLYGMGGEDDGYIQGYSKEGAPKSNDIAWIELTFEGIDPVILTGLIIAGIIICIILGVICVIVVLAIIQEQSYKISHKHKKLIEKDILEADWLNRYYKGKLTAIIKKEINQYITLKLVGRRTFIYVNGKRFMQCIRLILNIPKDDVPLYDEVDSIDEAAQLYNKHVFQNRIVRGPIAAPVPNQTHDITPEQEFWGHCSNIQAWVEHDYDTRILMSNISFPLLRELASAGDPVAKKVFKEEIALRLESGYPSVVQYLLNQGYLRYFTPSEFKTVIETTELIKGLSSSPKMFSRFLMSCVMKFPTVVEDILIQVLKVPEGKKLIISSMSSSLANRMPYFRSLFGSNPKYLVTLKGALENLFKEANEEFAKDILDCIQVIEDELLGKESYLPNIPRRDRFETFRDLHFDKKVLGNLGADAKLQFVRKHLRDIHRIQSKCPYCGKMIPRGQDTCDWCGHKKDDDEGGFFPFPFIFKPPGGGGSMKGTIAVPIKIKS